MNNLQSTKLDLSEPEKFQMATIVIKDSKRGYTSNKRLLAIRKSYLYYYSKVPKKFKGQSTILQTIHKIPKCSIQIVNIKQIKGFENNSSVFSIQFQAKNMLQQEDIRKTMTLEEYNFLPKNINENIVWQFTCDNQFIKQRWVSALQGLRTAFMKEKKDIQKFFNDHNSQMKSSSSGSRNSAIPWRESQSLNKKVNGDVNYLQLITGNTDNNGKELSSYMNDRLNNNKNLLQVNNNNLSRFRGSSTELNNTKNTVQQMKQYSPKNNNNELKDKQISYITSSVYQKQSISISSPSNNNKNSISPTRTFQSIILQPGDHFPNSSSPIHIMKQQNSLIESKTSQILIKKNSQIKQQDLEYNQSSTNKNKSPQQTPIKLQENYYNENSSEDQLEKQAELFQKQIKQDQISNINNSYKELKFNKNNNNNENNIQQLKLIKQESITQVYDANKNLIKKQSKHNNNKSNNNNNKRNNINININKSNKIMTTQQKQQIIISQQLSYYSIQQYLFNSSFTFNQKLRLQNKFHSIIQRFKLRATLAFRQFIHKKIQSTQLQSQQHQLNPSNQTKIHLKQQNLFIKLAYSTTQHLMINNQTRLFYYQENIKNLKREYKIYEKLFKNVVLSQIRSQGKANNSNINSSINSNSNININSEQNALCRLRVPLCVFVQYKGVTGLIFDYFNTQKQQIDMKQNKERKKYSKQIQIIKKHHYDINLFKFKRVTESINSQHKQFLTLYLDPSILQNRHLSQQQKRKQLKQLLLTNSPLKHHNIQFNPPFTSTIITSSLHSNASLSIQSLQKYIKTLKTLKSFNGICPKQEIIQIFQIIIFCKQLRKIYRVAQGEINETDFLNLIFKKDQKIMKMLEESGVDDVKNIKGILFDFLKYYLGIQCVINQNIMYKTQQHNSSLNNKSIQNNSSVKNKSLILSTQVFPLTRSFSLQSLQLFQSSSSLQKFIQQQKYQLALKSLQILRFICNEQQQSKSLNHHQNQQNFSLYHHHQYQQQKQKINNNKFRILYNSALLCLIRQKDYLKSLELCKQAENLYFVQHHSNSDWNSQYNNNNNNNKVKKQMKLFLVYFHMLKCYSHILNEGDFNLISQKLINLVQFNYGKQNYSLNIKVYQIISYYLVDMAERKSNYQEKNNLINQAITFIQKAMEITLKLFGQNSSQFVDLLIDSSKIFKHKSQPKSIELLNKARTLAISMNNPQKIIYILLQQLKNELKVKNYQKCEQILTCLYEIPVLYSKNNINNLIQILTLQYQLGKKTYKIFLSKQSIDKLWLIGNYKSKKQSLKLIIKLLQFEQAQQRNNSQNSSQNRSFKFKRFFNPYDNLSQSYQYNFDDLIKIIQQKFDEDYNQTKINYTEKFKRIDLYDWIKEKINEQLTEDDREKIWEKIIDNLRMLCTEDY